MEILEFSGNQQFPKNHRGWSLYMTEVEDFSFIGRGGKIWDRAGNLSKVIARGSHRGTSH